MIYNIILKNKRKPAFTLIEILVSVSILAVILLLVNRIYFSISDSQKTLSSENIIQADIEYFNKFISNNIRLAEKSDGILCSIPADDFFALNATSSSITFIKDSRCLTFYLVDDSGLGRIKLYDSFSGADQFITSESTNILSLVFDVEDNIDTGQPLVTMLTKFSPVSDTSNFSYIQNTVSVLENVVPLSTGGTETWACGGDIFDAECNYYSTVEIGTQCWMAENLAYLPVVHNNADFESQGSASLPGYGVHSYDGSDVSTAKALPNYSTYGVLYNWYAAFQVSICPEGWSVPTDAQWTTLTNYLSANSQYWCGGSSTQIGKSLASASGWASYTTVCSVGNDQPSNNTTGFNGLPAANRYPWGVFDNFGSHTDFWSSSEYDSVNSWRQRLYYSLSTVARWYLNKDYGFSVRCLKN